jgi:hypothetical protein
MKHESVCSIGEIESVGLALAQEIWSALAGNAIRTHNRGKCYSLRHCPKSVLVFGAYSDEFEPFLEHTANLGAAFPEHFDNKNFDNKRRGL